MDFTAIDKFAAEVERTQTVVPRKVREGETIKLGLDLGTCFTVLVALDGDNRPLACEMERSNALKDGVVVDYHAACDTVKRLKDRMEKRLGAELTECTIAMPPGTEASDSRTHRYVASAAGLEVTGMIDEPSAANLLLGMKDGAVVDIGGGTTGISVLKDGEVVFTADQPTGGTHLTLVISGNRHISFDEAEVFKMNPANQSEVLHVTTPVIEKMGQIILDETRDYRPAQLCLVGGTCCLAGLDKIIEKYTGIPVVQPEKALLITPIGIAMAHGDPAYRL